jgi:hypothetical protein
MFGAFDCVASRTHARDGVRDVERHCPGDLAGEDAVASLRSELAQCIARDGLQRQPLCAIPKGAPVRMTDGSPGSAAATGAPIDSLSATAKKNQWCAVWSEEWFRVNSRRIGKSAAIYEMSMTRELTRDMTRSRVAPLRRDFGVLRRSYQGEAEREDGRAGYSCRATTTRCANLARG